MHPVRICSLVVVSIVALAACGRRSERNESAPKDPIEQDRSGVTTLTGAAWVANDAAIDRVVASRCAREITCSNVGPDKHFVTGEACLRELRKTMHQDLKVSECPGGIDGHALDQCLESIRKESCTNPLDTVSRLAACRTGELCMKSEMPHR